MKTLERITITVAFIEFMVAVAFAKVLKVGADEMAKKQGYKDAWDFLDKVTK